MKSGETIHTLYDVITSSHTISDGDLGFSLPKSVRDFLNSTVQHTKNNLEDAKQISEPVFWWVEKKSFDSALTKGYVGQGLSDDV